VLAMKHDTFSRNTRNQLKQVFDALHQRSRRRLSWYCSIATSWGHLDQAKHQPLQLHQLLPHL